MVQDARAGLSSAPQLQDHSHLPCYKGPSDQGWAWALWGTSRESSELSYPCSFCGLARPKQWRCTPLGLWWAESLVQTLSKKDDQKAPHCQEEENQRDVPGLG